MAKTKNGKKVIPVKPHERNGSPVRGHRRSTPNERSQPSKEKGSLFGRLLGGLFK